MIKLPKMIIIGAGGRNIGKTEYACQLIKNNLNKGRIVGLKVTTVSEKNGKCPRGGNGCGVCSSLEENFCLTLEETGPEGKDTTKMIQAGASRVYWLRVLKDKLEEGFNAFLKKINPEDLIICESNSLRSIVEPGLFLVIKDAENNKIKKSCQEVIDYADYIVIAKDNSWDLLPEDIIFDNNYWKMQRNATVAILAGGKSRRMGRDKSLLQINNISMIEHIKNQVNNKFKEILVSANDLDKYKFLQLPIIADEQENFGPLMGIMSVLKKATYNKVLILSCDVPIINLPLINRLLQLANKYDVVVPRWKDGKIEPLFAVYNKNVIPMINEMIIKREKKIRVLYPRVNTKYYDIEKSKWYKNINTKEDYEEYLNDFV